MVVFIDVDSKVVVVVVPVVELVVVKVVQIDS